MHPDGDKNSIAYLEDVCVYKSCRRKPVGNLCEASRALHLLIGSSQHASHNVAGLTCPHLQPPLIEDAVTVLSETEAALSHLVRLQNINQCSDPNRPCQQSKPQSRYSSIRNVSG